MKKKIVVILTVLTLLVAMAACGMTASAQQAPTYQQFTGDWFPLSALTPERGTLTGHFAPDLDFGITDEAKDELAQLVRFTLTASLYPAGTDETNIDIRNENFDALWELCKFNGIEPENSEVSTDEMRLALLKLFSTGNYGKVVFDENATPQEAIEAMAQLAYRTVYLQMAYFLEYYHIDVDKYDDADVMAKLNALFPEKDVNGFDPYVFDYDLKLKNAGNGTLHFDFAIDRDASFGYPEWFKAYVEKQQSELPTGYYWLDLSPEDFASLTVKVLVNDKELEADATGFDVPLVKGENEVKLQVMKKANADGVEDLVVEYTVNISVSDEDDSSEEPGSSTSDPQESSKGDESSKPDNSSSQNTSSSSSAGSSSTKAPNTGEAGVAGLVVLALTAGATVVVFRKKHS